MPNRSSQHVAPIDQLVAAALAVPGVLDAQVKTNPTGEHRLALEIMDGLNEFVIAERVARVVNEQQLGLLVEGTPAPISPTEASDAIGETHSATRPVRLERVQVSATDLECEAEVTLSSPFTALVHGSASGPNTERAMLRTVATATLQAVGRLIGRKGNCVAEYVDTFNIGADQVALVLVTLTTAQRTDRLPGVALVCQDARQAAARATLSALNRRLGDLLIPSRAAMSTKLGLAGVTSRDPHPTLTQRWRPLELPSAESENLPASGSEAGEDRDLGDESYSYAVKESD